MNFKIGNDIIETQRIKKIIEKYPNKFKNRIFTEKEINYCENKGLNKFQSYAARFAAKEAIFKALSDYLENKYSVKWKDIEILNNPNGKPYVKLRNINFVNNIEISISHVKEYAIATALIYSD